MKDGMYGFEGSWKAELHRKRGNNFDDFEWAKTAFREFTGWSG
jgi:hypothetical protein